MHACVGMETVNVSLHVSAKPTGYTSCMVQCDIYNFKCKFDIRMQQKFQTDRKAILPLKTLVLHNIWLNFNVTHINKALRLGD